MERAHSPVQPLLYARDEHGRQNNDGPLPTNVTTGTPENFGENVGDVSPLRGNEARDEPGRFGHGSPLPTDEEPSIQVLLNDGDIEMDLVPRQSQQGLLLPNAEVPPIRREDSGDTRRTNIRQRAAQSKKRFPKALARIGLGSRRASQSTSRMCTRSWTTETCSYMIAILALAGLVATLSAHQGKPLPQWPQLVTINSIISLFSLLMRACVGVVLAEGISQCKWNWYRKVRKLDQIERLDSASRGSWGAITLLYHWRPKHAYYLATMGAIITLMASPTGFFAQQLVQFQDCLEIDTAALVNISRTNSYEQAGQFQSNAFTDYPPMVAAINVGVLQRPGDLTSALSSGCSSGNCTFSETGTPSFSTLAISHSCEDITAQIYLVNETLANEDDPYTRAFLGLDYGKDKTFEWSREQGGPVVLSWVDQPSYSIVLELIAMYFLFRQTWYPSGDRDWKATTCSLFPTINTYASRIKDARLDENPVDIVPLKALSLQFRSPPVNDQDFNNLAFSFSHRTITNSTIQSGIRKSCEGSATPAPGLTRFLRSTDESTYVNLTGHVNPSPGWKWWYYPFDCAWSIRRGSTTAIANTLASVFGRDQFNRREALMGLNEGVEGSAPLVVMFQDGNITFDSINEHIRDLATAMTTVVRKNGGDGNVTNPPEDAIGTVWNNTTCMYIRWSWITFPSVMIGLTGLFLLLVAFENRGVETDRLWKSSFLAALFCEVEVPTKPVEREEMKALAKSTSVSLEDKRATLRLVVG